MQALSSQYAGAYGGYGRQSALGGYGQKVQVVQPPPPGLAVQSLYESQVSGPPRRNRLSLQDYSCPRHHLLALWHLL
jgi:hypothetical protein